MIRRSRRADLTAAAMSPGIISASCVGRNGRPIGIRAPKTKACVSPKAIATLMSNPAVRIDGSDRAADWTGRIPVSTGRSPLVRGLGAGNQRLRIDWFRRSPATRLLRAAALHGTHAGAARQQSVSAPIGPVAAEPPVTRTSVPAQSGHPGHESHCHVRRSGLGDRRRSTYPRRSRTGNGRTSRCGSGRPPSSEPAGHSDGLPLEDEADRVGKDVDRGPLGWHDLCVVRKDADERLRGGRRLGEGRGG